MKFRRALLACVCAAVCSVLSTSSDRAAADDVTAEPVEITPEPAAPPEPEEAPPSPYDFTRSGWYLQAQWAYAIQNFGDTRGVEYDNANGGNAAAGYRFHPLGGMDFEFEYIDQFNTDIGQQQVNSTGNISLNGRLYPLGTLVDPGSVWARFQPFLKTGVAWMWLRQQNAQGRKKNNGAVAGRFGGGMDFYINNHAVITAFVNFMLPNHQIEDRQYLTVGAGFQWRFGSPSQ